MNYIFYQTKTNFSNTGDALINQSLINVLRNYGKLYANCSPDIPEQFLEQLGIAKSEQLRTRNEFIFAVYIVRTAFRNLFSSNKIFLFSGLGHTYGGSLKKIIRNIIAGVLFPFYRLLNVHIVRIGISIGPISKGLAMTEFIRGLFISKYYVRDTMSLKLCHNIGIGKAELCPDMSWLYRIGTLRNLNTNSNWVIVNLRNSTLDEFVYDDYIKMLVEKCKVILHTINAAISNLSVLVTYQVTCDKEFSFRLYKELQNDFTVSFVEKQMDLFDVGHYYGKAIFNISNRMHSLLLGYKFGALPIALLDKKEHIKITATFDDNNLSELLFDIHLDENEIGKRINDIVVNRQRYYDKLILRECERQNEIVEILNEIFNENISSQPHIVYSEQQCHS